MRWFMRDVLVNKIQNLESMSRRSKSRTQFFFLTDRTKGGGKKEKG